MVPYCDMQAREIPFDHQAVKLQKLFTHLCGWYDVDAPGRDIWVTPCYGQYERPAAVYISVNGSPTRGCILVNGLSEHHIYFCTERLEGFGMKRLGTAQSRIVMEFLKASGFGPDVLGFEPAVCRIPKRSSRVIQVDSEKPKETTSGMMKRLLSDSEG